MGRVHGVAGARLQDLPRVLQLDHLQVGWPVPPPPERKAAQRGGGRTRPIRVRPNNGVNAWQISGGPELRADNDGVITIPVDVEAPIPNGWTILDD